MIRRIYLKMTGPQILASVSSMLCLLIDSVVISRFLGVLPSTGQTDDESSQDFEHGAYGDVRIVAIGE